MRYYSTVSALAIATAAAFLLANSAQSQIGAPKSAVVLQPTTPGTSQSGHANVSGTMRAGQFVGGGAGLTSVDATSLGGFPAASYLRSVPNPLNLSGATAGSYVIRGANTSSAGNSFGVLGEVTSQTAGGFSAAVRGLNSGTSSQGIGVWGSQAGSGWGVYGTTVSGVGVLGLASGATGSGVGGSFSSANPTGIGVYGSASSSTGINYAGYFEASSLDATGLFAASPGGAIHGVATGVTGFSWGGFFENQGTDTGRGIVVDSAGNFGTYSQSTKTFGTTYGGYFISLSPTGRGVYGFGSGLQATDVPYGVYGQANTVTAGYGVYANGDLGASGVKTFRIDHPDDPAHKYLLHYSAESPFPQNIYSGTVVTDRKGYAWVEMPDYFDKINTKCKYVLTIVDDGDAEGFAQAKVSRKMQGNRFQIRTSLPDVEVSWVVLADRNDRRIEWNRPSDIQPKRGVEDGKYQNPEYFGLGPEMGIDRRVDSDIRRP